MSGVSLSVYEPLVIYSRSVGSNTGEAGDDSASGPASEDEELPPHAAQCQCRECKERKR
jgi:hypothetical protein